MDLKCYIIAFFDQSENWHSVPFSMADNGNRKAEILLKALREAGLEAEKYGPYKRRV